MVIMNRVYLRHVLPAAMNPEFVQNVISARELSSLLLYSLCRGSIRGCHTVESASKIRPYIYVALWISRSKG